MRWKQLLPILMFIVLAEDSSGQYCTPDFSIGCSTGSYIYTLHIPGENSSEINILNGICNPGSYEDSTSIGIIFYEGAGYYTQITSGSAGNHVEIYIDFDDNEIFEAIESVGGSNYVSTSNMYLNLDIPLGAALNSHRMRIVLSADSTYPGINPCPWNIGSTGYIAGQVYDYTATIIANSCDTPTNLSILNVTDDAALFNWIPASGATNHECDITEFPNPPTGGNLISSPPYQISQLLSNTMYNIHLRTWCGNSHSEWKTITFTTTACPPPTGLSSGNISSTHASIAWAQVPGATYLYHFGAYTTMPPGIGSYTPITAWPMAGLTPNTTYCLWVRAVCDPGDMSDWAGPHCFTTSPTGIEIGQNKDDLFVQAYPNPVKNMITISAQGKTSSASIMLTDMIGKLVNSYVLTSEQMSIDMSSLAPGVYFIRYADTDHRQTIKIIKE